MPRIVCCQRNRREQRLVSVSVAPDHSQFQVVVVFVVKRHLRASVSQLWFLLYSGLYCSPVPLSVHTQLIAFVVTVVIVVLVVVSASSSPATRPSKSSGIVLTEYRFAHWHSSSSSSTEQCKRNLRSRAIRGEAKAIRLVCVFLLV